jgi:hypothetical protein
MKLYALRLANAVKISAAGLSNALGAPRRTSKTTKRRSPPRQATTSTSA